MRLSLAEDGEGLRREHEGSVPRHSRRRRRTPTRTRTSRACTLATDGEVRGRKDDCRPPRPRRRRPGTTRGRGSAAARCALATDGEGRRRKEDGRAPRPRNVRRGTTSQSNYCPLYPRRRRRGAPRGRASSAGRALATEGEGCQGTRQLCSAPSLPTARGAEEESLL